MALRQSPVVGGQEFLAKAERAFGERLGISQPSLRIGCEGLQHERIGKQARIEGLARFRGRHGMAGRLLGIRERAWQTGSADRAPLSSPGPRPRA